MHMPNLSQDHSDTCIYKASEYHFKTTLKRVYYFKREVLGMSMEMKGGKGSMSGKRKKFSNEQIKSLEIMFRSESKPEPRTKQQLASDLGLHPRQVAIWFQNRRARLKSKQVEKEYSVLKASYDSLASKFECLKKENQVLASQVQRSDKLGKDEGSTADVAHQTKHVWRKEDTENNDYLLELKEKTTYIFGSYEYETCMTLGETTIRNSHLMKEEYDVQSLVEPVDSSLTTSENSWDSSCFLEQTCNSMLWEF